MREKYRAVLVGCGGIANAWLGAIQERSDIDIVGLVDLKKSNADNLKSSYDILATAETGESLECMLQSYDPDIVFNCTVPGAHPIVTITALEHGCHVLGEKPLADNIEDAERMIAAAEESGKLFAVIQNRRYMANIAAFRRVIESGVLGDLTTINSDFYIGAHFDGFRTEMEHVLLLDMAVHSFDQARYISGTDAVSVYCHEWNPKGSWYNHGASVVAIFEMADGSVFNYRGSWCSEGLNTTWECDWRVIGEHGSARWDGGTGIQYEIPGSGDGLVWTGDVVDVDVDDGIKYFGHAGVIDEFMESLKTGEIPQTECHDNIKSLKMVLAAVRSAETGKRVKI